MKKLSVMHLANTNSVNIGNGALISGTERVLGEDLGLAIEWTREPWDDYTFEIKQFDETFVNTANKHGLLLVNGAVTFNGREYLRNAGMRFDLPLGLWKELKVPTVFYGLSFRFWEGQEYHHLDKLRESLRTILENPRCLFATRNDGTKEWLEQLTGISSEQISVIPDPALFVRAAQDENYPEIEPGKKNIILSFNNEDAKFRYRHLDRSRLIRNVAGAFVRLAEKVDFQIVLVPHYFDDFEMCKEFVETLPPAFAHQKIVTTGLVRINHAEHFYGRYRQADLAVSMRVHSISPSIGLGTPVIPIVSQDRISTFLQKVGASHLGVDFADGNFSENLYAKMVHALENPEELRLKNKAIATQARADIKVFNSKIARLLNPERY